MHWAVAIPMAILHTAWGVMCVKVFAIMETMDMESAGNMSLFGAVFFMPVLYFAVSKITKRKLSDVFDICTVCMMFTLMCARVNCIITGCCSGLAIPGMNGICWPTRETELLFYVVMIILLGRKVYRHECEGLIYPIYMICYGIFRFMCEWFRFSPNTTYPIHIAHLWSIVAIVAGIIAYKVIKKKMASVI